MKTLPGEPEKEEKPNFDDTFLKKLRAEVQKSKDSQKSPASGNFAYENKKFSCTHSIDCEVLLAACHRFVLWIYENDIRYQYGLKIPHEHSSSLAASTTAALLFTYGKSNRPKKIPARNARFFGKLVVVDRERGEMTLEDGNLVLPLPPDFQDAEILKISFVILYSDRLEITARAKIPYAHINDIPDAALIGEMPKDDEED